MLNPLNVQARRFIVKIGQLRLIPGSLGTRPNKP